MSMAWIDKKPIIALAPMADMTDSPFCRVCREVAGKDFVVFREMVSSEALVRGNLKTLKMCEFTEEERPIVIQIFGADPKIMAEAARIIVNKFHPDGIDINMGCPVPKIATKSKAGAALMREPERAVEIVRAVKAENLGVPISVKTRLGWYRDDEILEFASRIEAAGADLITIHGRTKLQGYSGEANWSRIAKVKKIVSIPVLANGDINFSEKIAQCLEDTGVDGIMLGRGALGNPWIFLARGHGKYSEPTAQEIKNVVLRHAQLHVERYGERSIVTFRKHLLCYFRGGRSTKEFRGKLALVGGMKELVNLLR